MSDLTNKFQDIIKDIQNNISDEKELDYINKKIAEISIIYMDVIDSMKDIILNKIDNIEKVQNSIESKVSKIQSSISDIESDIYEDEYDFEIVCPYCNNIFTADIESKSSIKCPECSNTIELDWNEDDSQCPGSCSSCGSHCKDLDFNENNNDDDDDDM